MIPYFEQPVLSWGPFTISAFQVFVGLAVVVGFEVTVHRAPKVGLDRKQTAWMVLWTLLCGFVASHLVAVVAYDPEQARENPLELLRIWGSMSNLGGMAGGILGAIALMAFLGWSRRAMLVFLDCLAFTAPFAWTLGRAGCALAHDHPGIASDRWFAVRFPDGPRFDLGLIEFVYFLLISGTFLVLDRRRRADGFYLGLFLAIYGPVRFALDLLRVGEARYLGWTPGQYLSVAATFLGAGVLIASRRLSSNSRRP